MRTFIRTILHFIANWFFNSACLFACIRWLPGMQLTTDPAVPLYLPVMELGLALTVMNTTLRPILLLLLLPLNGITVGLFSIVLNGLFILLLDRFSEAFSVENFWTGLAAVFIFAALNMILQFFIPLDDDIIYYSILGQRRADKKGEAPKSKGIVMLEIDGLSYPRLMSSVKSGRMPFLKDLINSGLYTARPYDCGVPSQTSSCQAGIMYGKNENICAFRWYDKANQRVFSSSKTQDAADMERMLFKGENPSGILNNGMSINNIISGNASENILTISRLLPNSREEFGKVNQDMYLFALRPYLLTKSIILTILDAGREVLSYFRDVICGKKPRLNRLKGFYPFVRGATNILLRDLSTAMVADAVATGKEAVYTTFIGYDEIAHHNGPDSHDAINALGGIDRAIRKIYESIQITNSRSYEMVILSDHGQSFGSTFKQRYGTSLADYIKSLAVETSLSGKALNVVSVEDNDDNSVNVVAMLNTIRGKDSNRFVRETAGNLENALSEGENEAIQAAENTRTGILVLASGNLVNAYFQDRNERMSCEEIESLYPGMISKLASHPGIGIVLVHSENGVIACGRGGIRNLSTGETEGEDPLAMYGDTEKRTEQLLYLMSFPNGGDLVIISPVYPDGTVAAYEELIGSHGGLGGQQTEPFLMYSSAIHEEADISNSREVYAVLNRIKNTPSPTLPKKGKEKDTTSLHAMLQQIIHIRDWIFVLARTMFFSPSAYREIAQNPAFNGPAILVGSLTFISTWFVMNNLSGSSNGASYLINLVILGLIYAIEMTASYITIIILRGERHPWVMIRTILFTSYFGFLWLFLLRREAIPVWVTIILLLRVTALTSSVISAGALKRRHSIPVFLFLIILIPVLSMAVLMIFNFIRFTSTGQVTTIDTQNINLR